MITLKRNRFFSKHTVLLSFLNVGNQRLAWLNSVPNHLFPRNKYRSFDRGRELLILWKELSLIFLILKNRFENFKKLPTFSNTAANLICYGNLLNSTLSQIYCFSRNLIPNVCNYNGFDLVLIWQDILYFTCALVRILHRLPS